VSMIHKFITSIWNKEELPDQYKESIHEKSDKIYCINYPVISPTGGLRKLHNEELRDLYFPTSIIRIIK
jgi:hypothetical protein